VSDPCLIGPQTHRYGDNVRSSWAVVMDLVLRLARLDLLPPSLEHALDHDVWGPLDSPTPAGGYEGSGPGPSDPAAAANGDAAAAAAGGGGDGPSGAAAAAGEGGKGGAAAAAAGATHRARKRSRRYVQTGKASSKSGGVGTGFLRSLIMLQVSWGGGGAESGVSVG
jgi:hypothetical protein